MSKRNMTQQDIPLQDFRREDGDEPQPKTIWGHSLPAAIVCLAAAAIAVLAIFGQPG
jgi:hypothetical protein